MIPYDDFSLCRAPVCSAHVQHSSADCEWQADRRDRAHCSREQRRAAFRQEPYPDERRAFENMMLLCATCHTLADGDDKTYTRAKLIKWKHER